MRSINFGVCLLGDSGTTIFFGQEFRQWNTSQHISRPPEAFAPFSRDRPASTVGTQASNAISLLSRPAREPSSGLLRALRRPISRGPMGSPARPAVWLLRLCGLQAIG